MNSVNIESLKKNFYYYIANQNELVSKYDGKYLVIKDNQVQSTYDIIEDALRFGKQTFGMGNFIIQKCGAGEENYTTTIHSPFIFAQHG